MPKASGNPSTSSTSVILPEACFQNCLPCELWLSPKESKVLQDLLNGSKFVTVLVENNDQSNSLAGLDGIGLKKKRLRRQGDDSTRKPIPEPKPPLTQPKPKKLKMRRSIVCKEDENDEPCCPPIKNDAWKWCAQIIDRLFDHEKSEPFLYPVDPDTFPNYREVIALPMDLTRIRNRLERGWFYAVGDFAADVRLVWNNALQFNCVNSEIYIDALHFFRQFDDEKYSTGPDDNEVIGHPNPRLGRHQLAIRKHMLDPSLCDFHGNPDADKIHRELVRLRQLKEQKTGNVEIKKQEMKKPLSPKEEYRRSSLPAKPPLGTGLMKPKAPAKVSPKLKPTNPAQKFEKPKEIPPVRTEDKKDATKDTRPPVSAAGSSAVGADPDIKKEKVTDKLSEPMNLEERWVLQEMVAELTEQQQPSVVDFFLDMVETNDLKFEEKIGDDGFLELELTDPAIPDTILRKLEAFVETLRAAEKDKKEKFPEVTPVKWAGIPEPPGTANNKPGPGVTIKNAQAWLGLIDDPSVRKPSRHQPPTPSECIWNEYSAREHQKKHQKMEENNPSEAESPPLIFPPFNTVHRTISMEMSKPIPECSMLDFMSNEFLDEFNSSIKIP